MEKTVLISFIDQARIECFINLVDNHFPSIKVERFSTNTLQLKVSDLQDLFFLGRYTEIEFRLRNI